MAKLHKEQQTEVSLEDLLRLKRSERPSDQFWNEFDRELHQRMLQTLVKKDPWYLQVMRVFSGRILQNAAVVAMVVFVAMVVVRPAFQPVSPAINVALAPVPEIVRSPVVVAVSEPAEATVSSVPSILSIPAESVRMVTVSDYGTDAFSVAEGATDATFIREFGMESIQVASYDAAAYSTDLPQARASFASAGVASLVY